MEQNGFVAFALCRIKRFGVAALLGVAAVIPLLLCFAAIAAKFGRVSLLGPVGVYAAAFVGGMLAGAVAARSAGKNGLANGIAAAACCGCFLALIALIPHSDHAAAVPLPVLVCVVGGAPGGLIGVNCFHR